MYKIILLAVIILLFLQIFTVSNNEAFTTDETVNKLSSFYSKDKMVVDNLQVTDDIINPKMQQRIAALENNVTKVADYRIKCDWNGRREFEGDRDDIEITCTNGYVTEIERD